MAIRRFNKESYNRDKMNVRIENTYTQSGRIANPTEQVANPTEQEIRPSRPHPNDGPLSRICNPTA